MSEGSKSLRIDWFDGSLIEETRSSVPVSSEFDDEEPEPPQKPIHQKRRIGFKKLLELSMLNPPTITLEISHKQSFWELLDSDDLKDDFIVLIVKILSKLYKIAEGETSTIMKSLKSKFLNSKFTSILTEYLRRLPHVRIVDKRMNAHLWDDVESFYCDVYSLCRGILNIGNNTYEHLEELQELLEVTEISASGVKEEHSERLSDSLFKGIDELKWEIKELLYKQGNTNHSASEQVTCKDSTSFKYLSLFPSRNELLSKNEYKIEPNIINGAYPNVEHYLDLQFKLLREDCFGPLREGICKFLENPRRRKHENIRIYPKVRIIRAHVSNNKVGHLVDLAWKERQESKLTDFRKYIGNKQLMFGSLLLFTNDNFQNILCATVLDSSSSLLSEGYVTVTFQKPVSKEIFVVPYLMVESEVFFEPYHRVLKVLQNSKIDTLPMRAYIVDVKAETRPPNYLTHSITYNLHTHMKDTYLPVLDLDKWPQKIYDFDDSQMRAFKLALTREFAVIQGPPGTGKTYIGVKIASTLLQNLSLEGTPMLIICYTNHALDQFLEGILQTTTSVVRLGSQCKHKIVEQYTLGNIRGRVKSKHSYLYAAKRRELQNLVKQMTELQSNIEKSERDIICYKSIKPYLKINNKSIELKCSKEDPILYWLFQHLECVELSSSGYDAYSEDGQTFNIEGDWEKYDTNTNVEEIVTCFSDEWALKEIDSLAKSKNYINDVTEDDLARKTMIERLESQITTIRKRLQLYKKYQKQYQQETTCTNLAVQNLQNLLPDERWMAYFYAVKQLQGQLTSKMDSLLEQYNSLNDELDEISTLIDGEVMRTARVVGVTTTTAARRHDLMRKLLSPIVIVEEAAEVLEAHIVASLTDHCQHLILIGDHKQLRPAAAHYKLAKHFNFEISLFERMIRNGVHACTLTTQRRMRESFVELLVPLVYEKLDCHEVVKKYPHVRGMVRDLYFYDHNSFEDSEGLDDGWSHKNTFEAKWCMSLANYLRQMGYESADITLLAAYTGQAQLLKELSKSYELLRDVKITAVDNYQGEENRIVILSLVRSNGDGKIGFLAAQNRVCVALSRAKEGFYMFGNMSLLKSASSMWNAINCKLEAQQAIGSKITLCCNTHTENTLYITNVDDFKRCLSGSCLSICKK